MLRISIFLYNSELWTLTKAKEQAIDSFQRRILRTACMNIRWPKKISNAKVYEVTQVKPWSQTIQILQMKRLRYLIRLPDNTGLPDNTPAKTTLKYLNEETKRPRGRQRTTWKKMMEKNLNDYNLN